MLRKLTPAVLTGSVLLALALRVVAAYPVVFTAHGVSFQEADAWFHMRSIHNLLAHFPRRSGFDPYGVFPGGTNVWNAPLWDYLVGLIAWIAGFGKPSEALTDAVGAWLPAILGGLFPLLAWRLTRLLFGPRTGLLCAVWTAIIPGTFLWVSHLGMPDHHALETFLSFLSLLALCYASEFQGRRRWALAALAGVALGAYLGTRSAGIFVPAAFTIAAVIEWSLADIVAVAVGIAGLLFCLFGAGPWASFTWLTLGGCLTVTVSASLLRRLIRNASGARVIASVGVFLALAVLSCVLVPALRDRILDLARVIERYLPGHDTRTNEVRITELQPLWSAAPGRLLSLISQFGLAWIPALPGVVILVREVRRTRRAASIVFAIWSFIMIAGVILQLRMAAYAGFIAAILAAVGTERLLLLVRIPLARRWYAPALLLTPAMIVAGAVSTAQIYRQSGPDDDWMAALTWLRGKTPEPMNDARAWYGFWPAQSKGTSFVYPVSAYGVLAPWDAGWWINGIARRIPVSNGEQDGATLAALFFTVGAPHAGLAALRESGAKYVVVGPRLLTGGLPALVANAGGRIEDYTRLLEVPHNGELVQIRVYLPEFYRMMATRLYLSNGRETRGAGGVTLFGIDPEPFVKGAHDYEDEYLVRTTHHFSSEQEAIHSPDFRLTPSLFIACLDPVVSCVDLEALDWAQLAFESNHSGVSSLGTATTVKVFQRSR